ncbi:MAG: sensor histidine kinase [Lachnospiraceae bacterium]|nr:sensor histidine kinase [Lachnospiraceae bacterium]
MQLRKYLKDRLFVIIFGTGIFFVLFMLLVAFKVPASLKAAFTLIFWFFLIVAIGFEYVRRYRFFDELKKNIDGLDQKYLVLETLERPDFYEGQIMTDMLYEIDKSMAERVKEYSMNIEDFKEYIEMWIHEVKIPVSSLLLMCHNHQDALDKKYISQIKRLDRYIDQVLYYVRAEHAEKDYRIKKTDLKKLVHKVVMSNKDDLLESDITPKIGEVNRTVITDAKWLEFILNQLINNAVKYKREDTESEIIIWAEEENGCISLHVRDNGIGIPSADINRIFDKSFTGENGRKHAKSTGMGLYIAKNLCRQLGHGIDAQSVLNEYTDIRILFGVDGEGSTSG